MTEWTQQDRDAANREGWDLFDSDDSDNGPLQLCKIDDPPLWRTERGVVIDMEWTDDTQAWEYIAAHPSPLHDKALAMLAKHNPREVEAITRWNDGKREHDEHR